MKRLFLKLSILAAMTHSASALANISDETVDYSVGKEKQIQSLVLSNKQILGVVKAIENTRKYFVCNAKDSSTKYTLVDSDESNSRITLFETKINCMVAGKYNQKVVIKGQAFDSYELQNNENMVIRADSYEIQ